MVLVFVEHNEDEGKPWAEVVEGGFGDFFGEDGVFDGEDGGAGDAEEKLIFFDVLDGDCDVLARLFMAEKSTPGSLRGKSEFREQREPQGTSSKCLPTPRPASMLRKSFSSTLLLISAPELFNQDTKAALASSKGSMGVEVRSKSVCVWVVGNIVVDL